MKTNLFILVAALMVAGPAFAQDKSTTELSTDMLCSYVKDKKELKLVYKKDPADAEARVFQPYAVGTTGKKSVLMFGYQTGGHAKTKKGKELKLPDWRNFTVKKISKLEISGATFETVTVPEKSHKHIKEFICKNDAVK
ncbi:MAG: hypothetical protein V4691_08390 [Pseudomonadota bacterium]